MTLPPWLAAHPGLLHELERWFTDTTLKGQVTLFFRHAELTRIEPTPVLDGAALKSARAGKLACPDCQGPTEERDYGGKLYCGACDRTWPRWKIEQLVARGTGDARQATTEIR